jgi:hypothetical protein
MASTSAWYVLVFSTIGSLSVCWLVGDYYERQFTLSLPNDPQSPLAIGTMEERKEKK